MKVVIWMIVVVLGTVCNVDAAKIQAGMTASGNNTLITCVPQVEGEVEKAYLSLYSTNGHEVFLNRKEMEVSFENVATYVLPGTHEELEGKCKIIIAGGDVKILREDFSLSKE